MGITALVSLSRPCSNPLSSRSQGTSLHNYPSTSHPTRALAELFNISRAELSFINIFHFLQQPQLIHPRVPLLRIIRRTQARPLRHPSVRPGISVTR